MRRACSSEVSRKGSFFRVSASQFSQAGPTSSRPVQAAALDLVRDRRRNELVDRIASSDPLPDLARRDGALVDLEDLDVSHRRRLPGSRRHSNGNQAQDLVWVLPRIECRPLIGADHEHRILPRSVSEQIDRVRVVVEPNLGTRQVTEGKVGELEPGIGVENRRLVPRSLGYEHEEPVGAKAPERSLGERHVTEMRRVEDAAEDGAPHKVTVSSPISTSAPGFAPAARNASSSWARSGGVPTTRKPRSVLKMR